MDIEYALELLPKIENLRSNFPLDTLDQLDFDGNHCTRLATAFDSYWVFAAAVIPKKFPRRKVIEEFILYDSAREVDADKIRRAFSVSAANSRGLVVPIGEIQDKARGDRDMAIKLSNEAVSAIPEKIRKDALLRIKMTRIYFDIGNNNIQSLRGGLPGFGKRH